ncbi:MAG TPA: hypothetical protein VNG69_04105 [Casimicrobiaceae bacterium]|nr:hypothetical protein [Casimicrobiaceae bacterium]
MALTGTGAVAIWHDIQPEGRDDFYAWHGIEHMPERAAIPGFVRGRRYVAIEGRPEFFNLYETRSTEVLAGADYLKRLNAPTPWTIATVKHFRDVARSLCEVEASFGSGDGGLIATFRYDIASVNAQAHRANMRTRLEALTREPGIAGAHLLVANDAASSIETAERRARQGTTDVPRWIVLVESWGDCEPFVMFVRELQRDAMFDEASIAPDWAVYRLQNACASDD